MLLRHPRSQIGSWRSLHEGDRNKTQRTSLTLIGRQQGLTVTLSLSLFDLFPQNQQKLALQLHFGI